MSPGPISVIIPTRDRGSLLQRALDSVWAQSLPPDEVIVVDDGDAPLDVPFLPGVHVVRQLPPHGAARARNLGASAAKGRFLAFLDDDDTWHSDYLAEAGQLASDGGLDLVLTAFLKVRERAGHREEAPEKVPPDALQPEDFLVRNPGIRGSNLFIARAIFLQVGGFDPVLQSFHDMDLGFRLALFPGLRYGRNTQHRVRFHVHDGLRLSTAGSSTNVAGLQGFLTKHAAIMGTERVAAFRERARQLFGGEP